MEKERWGYSTHRLLVKEWHEFTADQLSQQTLPSLVKEMLTPRVTRSLPQHWQGAYTLERAQRWIADRDNEGITLLAIDSTSKRPIGLVILFESAKGDNGADLRLGYILAESAWGKGFASELIAGLVQCSRDNQVATITAGVERDNIASQRVLEKNGFVCISSTNRAADQIFVLQLCQPPF